MPKKHDHANVIDAAIVGAGFAGLYMLHRLRGLGLTARVFEAGAGVGGTWYWNRYPGARCDIVSMEYSYQFSEELQQEWEWTERYASQPEILAYLNHVADRFNLRDGIQLNTRISAAAYDERENRWCIETDKGDRISARYCIMATGCLSSANVPPFPGLESFRGDSYHTAAWPPKGVDFCGRRVGIIGTGSSAIQAIPLIAQQAAHLYVFQRTPTYVVPAHNRPLYAKEQQRIKANYAAFREHNSTEPGGADFRTNYGSVFDVTPEERERIYEERWQSGGLPFMGAFGDLLFDMEANRTAQEFIRSKIRRIVKDPAVAEKLCPYQIFACKRLCVGTDYYETYNRPNVSLVDISNAPIEAITEKGLLTGGREYELDSLVFATGFDAMTGALHRIDIRGRDGLTLKEKWAPGPRNYLGLMTAGFPNLFTITGPGSPSVLSNMVPSIEYHVEWIAAFIDHARGRGCDCLEPTPEAEDNWVAHVNEVADMTLFPRCNSWYLGANIPGKTRVFMPFFGYPQYAEFCNDVAARGYPGFVLETAPGNEVLTRGGD
jgi:cation diffusion facilitator CzcD-associated flavoprotein CzcO